MAVGCLGVDDMQALSTTVVPKFLKKNQNPIDLHRDYECYAQY